MVKPSRVDDYSHHRDAARVFFVHARQRAALLCRRPASMHTGRLVQYEHPVEIYYLYINIIYFYCVSCNVLKEVGSFETIVLVSLYFNLK